MIDRLSKLDTKDVSPQHYTENDWIERFKESTLSNSKVLVLSELTNLFKLRDDTNETVFGGINDTLSMMKLMGAVSAYDTDLFICNKYLINRDYDNAIKYIKSHNDNIFNSQVSSLYLAALCYNDRFRLVHCQNANNNIIDSNNSMFFHMNELLEIFSEKNDDELIHFCFMSCTQLISGQFSTPANELFKYDKKNKISNTAISSVNLLKTYWFNNSVFLETTKNINLPILTNEHVTFKIKDYFDIEIMYLLGMAIYIKKISTNFRHKRSSCTSFYDLQKKLSSAKPLFHETIDDHLSNNLTNRQQLLININCLFRYQYFKGLQQ